jgi:CheY-like chemotaxis protein
MDTKTILVVEDDEETRTGFGMVLQDHGYAVGLAADGQEALDYVQNNGPPDLIFLDMMMPRMDGWQFLKRRGARWRSVPVLLVTALPISCNEWATSLGARCCLRKPFDPELLLGQVKTLLGSAGGAKA